MDRTWYDLPIDRQQSVQAALLSLASDHSLSLTGIQAASRSLERLPLSDLQTLWTSSLQNMAHDTRNMGGHDHE